MSRLIDLDTRQGLVWISYPYDATVTATVKTIAGRTFDSSSRRWSVPVQNIAQVIRTLDPLHFKFTPRMREWWLEHRDDVDTSRGGGPERIEVDPKDGFTVTRLHETTRKILADGFDAQTWLVAELEGYDRNKGGHAYFELVERVVAGGEVIAKVSAVMFQSTRRRIEEELANLSLQDGLLVRVRGRVDVYAPQGRMQFIVEGIDADWSVGAMRRRRDEILERLKARDLLEHNLSKAVPTCPLRLGIVTAVDSDAANDVLDELRRSQFAFDVTLHDARMQGRETEPSVTGALQWFAERWRNFDLVIVTRGGGSRTDLSHFDSLAIGEAVCRHPCKIVSGIGHHRDRCVLDFIAQSVKTPTAAGQLAVTAVERYLDRVERYAAEAAKSGVEVLRKVDLRIERSATRLERRVAVRLREAERRYTRAEAAIVDGARARVSRSATRLASLEQSASNAASQRVREVELRVDWAERSLRGPTPRRPADEATRRVDQLTVRLDRVTSTAVQRDALRVDHAEATLRLADPRRILERGFAIVRDADGAIVTRAEQLAGLESARVSLPGGSVVVEPKELQDDG